MRFLPKFRLAILLPALAAMVALLPLLWIFFTGLLQRSVVEQLQGSLPVVARLVQPRLSEDPRALQDWFVRLAGNEVWRITLIAEDGTVLADSERTWEEVQAMENHAGRPEVLQARSQGRGVGARRSATLREDFVYAAQLLQPVEGRTYVLRLAQPIAALRFLRDRLSRLLALSTFAALAVMTLVSWWLDRKLLRPLSGLVAGANRLARGELSHRVEVPNEEELADLAISLNRLAERVEEQVAAVEAERSHLEVVGASMSEGILVTDEAGRALMANPSFRRLFRVRGEVVGRSILELTRQPRFDEVLSDVLVRGGTRDLELQLPGQRSRSVAVSVSALSDRSGVVVAVRDVTDLVALGEIRRDLVANVAHELKTPLAAIRGYAETLHDGALDDRRAATRFTARILDQCGRLQALLEDLLTLSSLERQDRPPGREPADLRRIVEEAIEVLGNVAREKQVSMEVALSEVPELAGEPEALEKLVLNLLDNAIKYNRPGGSVRVSLEEDAGSLVLVVADSGRGIPETSIPRLFERFYRVDRGRSRDEGGTGLGLAIVKHAAQRHGGSVEVESEMGVGSTFRVRLPLAG